MRRPNFFIVGAPKCGTTALSEYLRKHPNIFMSEPKEPHFFATDLPRYRVVNSEADYLKLFESATPDHIALGEASVFYLYSRTAMVNICDFAADAKIIVMLRNPVDLAHSMHSQLLYSRDEDVADFEIAWQKIGNRKEGSRIPYHCRDRKLLYYDEIAKIGEQLARLQTYFSSTQTKVIFLEDFANDTVGVYRDTVKFLGLIDDDRTGFPRINPNSRHKFDWMADFSQRPPRELVRIAKWLKEILGIEQFGIIPFLRKLNLVEGSRSALTTRFRREILRNYYGDIELLSDITGRDLSCWMDPI